MSDLGNIEVSEVETRNRAFIREHKIAGVIELREGGPTRLLFDAGGHIDVCGGAHYWRHAIELARLKAAEPQQKPTG